MSQSHVRVPAHRVIDTIWIPLSDGCRLSARVWLPADEHPAPAILEYLPYRKDDGTADQDATRHPYFAEHGFAAVRVDIRGTGDSDGVLLGEYLLQEQDDALEVIAWIAEQPWCSGSVGMIGYSWGGFNGLQVAARRPPALKAVVTAYSTDDRYRDDCHYMGGCLLASDMVKWATTMRGYMALPPDPRIRRDWREVWLERLEATPAFVVDWLSHQRRDEFWRHGSVAEDYSAIQAATLVVGGWADAYTNAVPRLLENLTCERKGIIGPWGHFLPYRNGLPGPPIGFLQECVRWFSRWLADQPTGVEDDPLLRVWLQDSVAPARTYRERPGEWLEMGAWPAPGTVAAVWRLDPDSRLARSLAPVPGDEAASPAAWVHIASPQHVGEQAGVWCANGWGEELAGDQRSDDELSAVFDSEPLGEPVRVLGTPVLKLSVASDRPLALVAARLCEVAADGASTLVTWGMLNLTRRDGDETTAALSVGQTYDVEVPLNVVGHRFSAGSRLRLSLSPTYWPHGWPSPEAATLTIGIGGPSSLELPVLADAVALQRPFAGPESTPSADRNAVHTRTRNHDLSSDGRTRTLVDRESERTTLPPDTVMTADSEDRYEVSPDDPLTALTRSRREWSLAREGWSVRVLAEDTITCDETTFHVDDRLTVHEGDVVVFERHERFEIPRDGV